MIVSPTDEFARNSVSYTSTANSTSQGFDAALQAQKSRQAQDAAFDKTFADIQEKGFRAWAKDVSMEKLKEILRKKLEAESENGEVDTSKLEAIIQQRLEAEMQQMSNKMLSDGGASGDPMENSTSHDGNIFPQGVVVSDSQSGEKDKSDNGGDFFIPSMM